MFSKKSLLFWLIALVGLAIIALVVFKKEESGNSNFKSVVNETKKESIDKIVYKTAVNNYDIVAERVNSEEWVIKANGKEEMADTVKINSMFILSSNVNPVRIAAIEESKWGIYEVDEEKGTHVQFFSRGKVVNDFYIGKNEWIDNDPNATKGKTLMPGQSFPASYMRVKGDNTVYMINGNVRFAYPDDFNRLRSQTIYSVNYQKIEALTVNTQSGLNINMVKTDNERWLRDGILVDSLRARTYVGKLRSMICNSFVDELPTTEPEATMTLQGEDMETIVVNFWPYDSVGYVINSSQNKDGYFLDKRGVLRQRIEKF